MSPYPGRVRNFYKSKIVLLEADASRRNALKSTFSNWGFIPYVFEKESICLDNLASLDPDLLISDTNTLDGIIPFIHSLKTIRADLPVLLLANDGALQDYVTASGLKGVQVYNKNTSLNDFHYAVLKAVELNNGEGGKGNFRQIVGNTPDVLKIKKVIPQIARSDEAVIIEGEPGTGKELVARAIHGYSGENDKPFVKVDAVGLPFRLLGGALFGHKNCGTAELPRYENGLLSAYDSVTLFIKEISALPKWLQSKTIDILDDDYRFDQHGRESNAPKVNIRIIVSTTTDLCGLIKKGLFREDLYYRLNVLRLCVPPLRDRVADIPELTDYFSFRHCVELDKRYHQISPRTIAGFCGYSWPGNLKELRRKVQQVILSGREDYVRRSLNEVAIREAAPFRIASSGAIDHHDGCANVESRLREKKNYSLKLFTREFSSALDRYLISKALRATNGNRKKAAEALGISYKSLLNKIRDLGLNASSHNR